MGWFFGSKDSGSSGSGSSSYDESASGRRTTGSTWLSDSISGKQKNNVQVQCLPPHVLYYLSYNENYLPTYYNTMEKYIQATSMIPPECLNPKKKRKR